MNGVRVNPAVIQPKDRVATKFTVRAEGTEFETIEIHKSREIKKTSFCPGKPEMVHLDHECYDTRFSTVIVPA